MSKKIMITGGAASGKSRWAATYLRACDNVLYWSVSDTMDADTQKCALLTIPLRNITSGILSAMKRLWNSAMTSRSLKKPLMQCPASETDINEKKRLLRSIIGNGGAFCYYVLFSGSSGASVISGIPSGFLGSAVSKLMEDVPVSSGSSSSTGAPFSISTGGLPLSA